MESLKLLKLQVNVELAVFEIQQTMVGHVAKEHQ
jgi:hypothetical protein